MLVGKKISGIGVLTIIGHRQDHDIRTVLDPEHAIANVAGDVSPGPEGKKKQGRSHGVQRNTPPLTKVAYSLVLTESQLPQFPLFL